MSVAYLVNCFLYMNINVLRHKPTKEFASTLLLVSVLYEVIVLNDSQFLGVRTFRHGTQTWKKTKVEGVDYMWGFIIGEINKAEDFGLDETGFTSKYWWLQNHCPAYIFVCVFTLLSYFLFVLMTLMMARYEAWALLFPLSRTDVLVWPLISVSHAIYHLHDWESALNTRWKPKMQ